MSRLRVGVVGTGFIAGRHLTALDAFEDVEVVAVADSAVERAEAAAQKYGGRAYDDGLALIAEQELDAVWLCAPPFAHGPFERAAVERGLPFFVEKPLSVDLAGAAEVARQVRRAGLATAVGYHWRSLSVVETAREALRDRPPHLLTATWLDSTPAAPWWSQRSGSGGQLVEQTTHLVDLARHLVGEITSVQALEVVRECAAWPGADVPTASAVLLRFASGAVGTVSSSCVLDRRHHVGVQLVAEGRLVELRESALSDHELRLESKDGEQVVRTREDPIAREDRAFVDALLAGTAAPVPYEDGLRTHAAVLAADLSARDGGRPVDVDPLLEEALRG